MTSIDLPATSSHRGGHRSPAKHRGTGSRNRLDRWSKPNSKHVGSLDLALDLRDVHGVLLDPALNLDDLLPGRTQVTDPGRQPGVLLDSALNLGDLLPGRTQVTDPGRQPGVLLDPAL